MLAHDAVKRHAEKFNDDGQNVSDDSITDEKDCLIPVENPSNVGLYDSDKRKQRCCAR